MSLKLLLTDITKLHIADESDCKTVMQLKDVHITIRSRRQFVHLFLGGTGGESLCFAIMDARGGMAGDWKEKRDKGITSDHWKTWSDYPALR